MWIIYKKQRKIKKSKNTGYLRYIFLNEVDRAGFQHNMVYGDFKDLTRGAPSDKILCDKTFNIATNSKHDGYQRELASMVYKFFDKKTFGSGIKN